GESPPSPLFPKTLELNLAPTGRSTHDVKISNNTESALTGLNIMLKVLGKEFEEEPFFKRVFLNITCKTSIRVLP
ncbi:MAG: hypothetical protein IKN66_10385, partial [Ruminococcus sp.]|nr:hypothetical protein [Ruminococcus sp.]